MLATWQAKSGEFLPATWQARNGEDLSKEQAGTWRERKREERNQLEGERKRRGDDM